MDIVIAFVFMVDIQILYNYYLGFYLEATRCFHGVYWHPYCLAYRVCHKPLGLFLWEQWHHIPIQVYNKSRYLAVRSGSVPDTPWPLSWAFTRPILNMVHRSSSVFNNLLCVLYAEVCGIGRIPMYTNRTSLNNIIITCYWYLTSDILDLHLWDLWHNILSCSPLMIFVPLCWITWLTYFQVSILFPNFVIV